MNIDNIPLGILNDRRIRDAVAWNHPLIKDYSCDSIQPCSYDLRVGTVFHDGKVLKWRSAQEQQVIIRPGGMISLFTHEELNLPNCIMATAFPMNYWSSQGLLVLNPGHVDPGYSGPLSVRLINLRSTPKSINFGDKIFTVIFEKLPEASVKSYSGSKMRDERERLHNSLDVEQNPGDLGQLILRGENPPFVSVDEVRKAILSHCITCVTFVLTAIAAIASIIAVIQAFKK